MSPFLPFIVGRGRIKAFLQLSLSIICLTWIVMPVVAQQPSTRTISAPQDTVLRSKPAQQEEDQCTNKSSHSFSARLFYVARLMSR